MLKAGLTLTAAGVADGFKLSTYATGTTGARSFFAAAPLLNPNAGNLAVIDFAHGMLRTYADVDGQVYGHAFEFGLPSAARLTSPMRAAKPTLPSQLVAGGLYEVSLTGL